MSQTIFKAEVLQTSDYFHVPLLDLLQHVHVLLILGASGLKAIPSVRSQNSGVRSKEVKISIKMNE